MTASRELDRAVAEAMGQQISASGRLRPDGGRCGVRLYSTDPACIPEMLAWLRAQWPAQRNTECEVLIEVGPPPISTRASVWDRDEVDHPRVIGATGTDICEALARLVVEVAKRRKANP